MKKLEINIPDGHEIDLDKSDLSKGIVFFKEVKKKLTYDDIAKELFHNKDGYYITSDADISPCNFGDYPCLECNVAATWEQLESILALNMLCNVAKYLNGGWSPINKRDKYKWCIRIDDISNELVCETEAKQTSSVYFNTKELAQQAIDILGEEEIRKALTLNH